jgi:hypothetical protein
MGKKLEPKEKPAVSLRNIEAMLELLSARYDAVTLEADRDGYWIVGHSWCGGEKRGPKAGTVLLAVREMTKQVIS